MSTGSGEERQDAVLRRFLTERAADTSTMLAVDEVVHGVGGRVRRHARRQRALRFTWVAVATAAVIALFGGASLLGSGPTKPAPTTTPSPTATPLPAATLGRLAYVLGGDVYVGDSDGSHAVRITGGSQCGGAFAEGPMWSPDGRYLAFRECDLGIVITDAAGARVATLPAGNGWQVAWSPDSNRVAFWLDFGHSIAVYGLDGTRQSLINLPQSIDLLPGDFDPFWAPDGTSLWMWGCGGVCEIPLDGTSPRPVPADEPLSHRYAKLSPNGTQVAYVASDGSIVVAPRAGSPPTVVVPAPSGSACGQGCAWQGWDSLTWSPSGTEIAFTVLGADGSPTEIRVVDIATGVVTTPVGAGEDDPSPRAFSSDGQQLFFSTSEGGGTESLWSVRVDGSDPHLLVSGASTLDWQLLAPG